MVAMTAMNTAAALVRRTARMVVPRKETVMEEGVIKNGTEIYLEQFLCHLNVLTRDNICENG